MQCWRAMSPLNYTHKAPTFRKQESGFDCKVHTPRVFKHKQSLAAPNSALNSGPQHTGREWKYFKFAIAPQRAAGFPGCTGSVQQKEAKQARLRRASSKENQPKTLMQPKIMVIKIWFISQEAGQGNHMPQNPMKARADT